MSWHVMMVALIVKGVMIYAANGMTDAFTSTMQRDKFQSLFFCQFLEDDQS